MAAGAATGDRRSRDLIPRNIVVSEDKSELLRSLSIDRSRDEDDAAGVRANPAALIAAALGLVAVGAGVGWFAKPTPEAAPVETATEQAAAGTPARAATPGGLTASGYVVARARATIAAEVTGRVLEVRVEEGQAVRKGQVLAILDGSIARADARTARARVDSAQADYGEALRALERAQTLSNSGFVSSASLRTAQARVESALAQLNTARSESSRSAVQLSKFEIRAPFSGIVIDKAAQAGEIISPLSAGGGFTRTGICTIVDMDSIEIEVDVNEAYIGRVSAGQKVEAVLDAYPDTVLPAHVIATIPTASRDKATVRVRIAFDAKDPRILPDMAIKVTFLEQRA